MNLPILKGGNFSLADAIRVQHSGDSVMAEQMMRKLCIAAPNDGEAHHALGMLLLQLGRPAEALPFLERAVKIAPNNAIYCNNCGLVYPALDRLDDAIASFSRAAALDPNLAAAHNSLGNALRLRGRYPAAAESCRRAIALSPNFAEAHSNLGNALMGMERYEEAKNCYERALAINPSYIRAKSNLGGALRFLRRIDDSVALLREVAMIAPGFIEASKNLAGVLLTGGDTEGAIKELRRVIAVEPTNSELRSTLLFSLLYSDAISEKALLQEHLDFFKFRSTFEDRFKADWPNEKMSKDAEKIIRIGYVSGDFREHAVSFFIEPILRAHDRSQFEVVCFSSAGKRDTWTERLAKYATKWVDVSVLSDQEMAAIVEAENIDILVDLSGHTAGNRLDVFAQKPAPVQMTWLGSAGTTGLKAIDYRITDAMLDPPGMTEAFHTETLIRLASSATFLPHPESPDVNVLPALSKGHITFGCLNTPRKFNRTLIQIWATLLKRIPTARLVLAAAPLQEFQQKLGTMFRDGGIEANRIDWLPFMTTPDFLKQHHEIDIALDTFPYNGGTTSNHALWMGVPVVSLAGTRTVSRVGAAVLPRAGLDDLVTNSPDEYIQRAVDLADDLERLNTLRQSMRERITSRQSSSPEGVTRDLEAHYRAAWKKWCSSGS